MRKLFSLFSTAAAALLLLPSCSKKIDEAYLNPNAQTVQPVEVLFPNLITNMVTSYSAAGSGYGTQNDGIYIGEYVQFWGRNTANYQYDQMGGTIGASDLLGSVWAMHYFGQGQNLNKVVEWGTEQKKWDFVGAAKAIRAWSLYQLTTSYSDGILDEAFNTSQLVFNYNDQPAFYAAVRTTAHAAIADLSKTDPAMDPAAFAAADNFFLKGDLAKWKKFAYGVLARSFNDLSNKTEYKPDSVIYYANLSMSTNADNGYVTFADLGNSQTKSYFGPFRGNIGALRQSDFIANLMNGLNPSLPAADPRAGYLLRLNPNGTFTGVTVGKGSAGLATNDRPENFWGGSFATTTGTNSNARYVFKDAMPWPIMTAAEMKFMIAEAQYRKGASGAALTAYTDGIRLSMDMLTSVYADAVPAGLIMTQAIKDAYLANPAVVPAANNLTLSQIMLQKYIAMFGFGIHETWTDLRRYHYTDLEAGTTRQVYDGFTPPLPGDLYPDNKQKYVYRKRPRYNSEYLYNITALDAIGARELDYHTKEMWFSQP